MTDLPPPSLALDAETLLSHGAWLAKFARALVANEADIDDVVQQTFATALARPPRHSGNLRGWLGTVARNVVRSNARSDNARAAREVARPPPPPVESPVEAVARAELRKKVVECVLALDEPYRSTVILRFFEEQEVSVIARLTSAGEDTVRTRIRRGVIRVRELLERRVDEETRGSAHEGVAAQALLMSRLRDIAASVGRSSGAGGGGAIGSSAASRGLGRMAAAGTTRRVLVGAVVVAAAGSGWWWWASRAARTPIVANAARSDAPAPTPGDVVAPATRTEVAAADERTATPIAPTPPPRPAKFGTIRGIVKDLDGNPVAGARVWAIAAWNHRPEGSLPEFARSAKEAADRGEEGAASFGWIGGTCGEDGRYEFTDLRTLRGWEVLAFEPTIGAGLSDVSSFDHDHAELGVDLQLARGAVIRGIVKGEDGSPIGNAQVILRTTYEKTKVLKSTIVSAAVPRTLGEFDIGFRCGESLDYECVVPGFLPKPRTKIEFPPRAKEVKLEITLQRSPGKVVRGRIVDSSGRPIELLPMLWERLVTTPPSSRAWKVTVRAIRDAAPAADTAAASVAPAKPEIVDGHIDFVKGTYEFVFSEDFHGTLELQIAKHVVGTVPLVDMSNPPDLPCDAERIPKESAPKTITIRFVDAETKAPIKFGLHDPVPTASFGSTLTRLRPGSDGEHGLIVYACEPGVLKIPVLIEGYAPSLDYVEVPEGEQRGPVSVEIPKANAGVHGFALRSDGRPLDKALLSLFRVTASGWVDATSSSVATTPDGEFEFDTLAKGEHVIVVSGAPDEAPGFARFLANDPPSEIEVRSAPGSLARFTLSPKLAAGASPDTRLSILDRDGHVVEASSSAWKLEKQVFDEYSARLRDGHYTVVVGRDGYRDQRIDFDVPCSIAIEVPLQVLEPVLK